MKKRKDKSTRAGFIAAAITTVLVGVTVFSLYSLAESNEVEHLTLAGTVAEGTSTGKLITRMDDAKETTVTFDKVEYAAPVQPVAVKAEAETPAEVEVVTETVEEIEEVVAPEGLKLIMINPETGVEPETVKEHEEAVNQEEVSYDDSVYELAYDESWYDYVSYEQSADSYAVSNQDIEYYGDWVYDEINDRWIYVEDGLSTPMAPSYVEESYDIPVYNEPAVEIPVYTEPSDGGLKGDWVYNYDTDEWEYVESADDSYEYETPVVNDTYDEDSNEETVEGDWLYNEETDEWYFVESVTGGSSSDDSMDYEEEPVVEEPVYSSLGQQIVDYAMGFVGVTPYVWAGRSLYSGTDCSGFVNLIYSNFGIYCSPASLAYDGSRFGYIVSAAEAQPGDIAVYGGGDHVAIYAGNGYVVHCSSPENGTVYWKMNYRSDLSWFLRVLG